jgi:hypothetical protein
VGFALLAFSSRFCVSSGKSAAPCWPGSRGYLVMNMILAALGQLALAAVTFYVLFWLLVVVGLVTLLRYVAKRIKQRLPQSPPPDPARLPG